MGDKTTRGSYRVSLDVLSYMLNCIVENLMNSRQLTQNVLVRGHALRGTDFYYFGPDYFNFTKLRCHR